MRKRSAETELRETKRRLVQVTRQCVRAEHDAWRLTSEVQSLARQRDEWKARFDELLKRVPEVPK